MIVKKGIILLQFILFSITMNCQNYFEQAYNEYMNGDLNKSIELFSNSIQNNQKVAESYMFRGAAKAFLNDFFHAIEDLNFSKNLDSNNYKVYYYYGKTYLLNNMDNLALENMNIAISLNKNDADVFDNRAAIKIQLGDYKGAIEDENEAIKINSNKDDYYINRGFAYFNLMKYETALKDYNKAIEIKTSQKVYANRGYVYLELKQYKNAINDFTKSLEFYKEDSQVLYMRGLSYIGIEDFEKGCMDFYESEKYGYELASLKIKQHCTK